MIKMYGSVFPLAAHIAHRFTRFVLAWRCGLLRRALGALNLIAASCLFIATTANAEALSRMLSKSGLTPEDVSLMTEAELSLYENTVVRNNSTAQWSNPGTTATGQVRLSDYRNNCARIDHVFTPRNKKTRKISYRICQQASGTWLFSAE